MEGILNDGGERKITLFGYREVYNIIDKLQNDA
jgi:hypothetical protein